MTSGKRSIQWLFVQASKRKVFSIFFWCCITYIVFWFMSNKNFSWSSKYATISQFLQKTIKNKSIAVSATENIIKKIFEFDFLIADPLIDKSPILSDQDFAAVLQKKYSNIPLQYWAKHKDMLQPKNITCSKFPSMFELNFNNLYWQTFLSSNGTFHLYAAYYDNRTLVTLKPVIRILGMIDRLGPTVTTFCQMWFDGLIDPIISSVFEYQYIWYQKWGNSKNGIFQPYLISCQVPLMLKNLIPVSVSLVEKPCSSAVTNLRVIYNKPKNSKRSKIAVCVKGLDFLNEDRSVRLVEWLELLFILGANKVFMYNLETHSNITKVLKFYENQGFVEVTPMTLPGTQPNLPGLMHMYLKAKVANKFQNELIPYNDCFYKNMYRYEYVVLLDTDEVIMPKSVATWKQLLSKIIPKAAAESKIPMSSYNVRNVYFLDTMSHTQEWVWDIPHYMHMLQHVYRSRNFSKPRYYVKCFHDTERVLTLHNHFPLSCLGERCSSYSVDTEDAQLQHYRANCVGRLEESCITAFKNYTVLDTTIWRYKTLLSSRVREILLKLGFLT